MMAQSLRVLKDAGDEIDLAISALDQSCRTSLKRSPNRR